MRNLLRFWIFESTILGKIEKHSEYLVFDWNAFTHQGSNSSDLCLNQLLGHHADLMSPTTSLLQNVDSPVASMKRYSSGLTHPSSA